MTPADQVLERTGGPGASDAPLPSRASRWLAVFSVASVLVSLVARLVYRGSYYPGWEILGPAHGTFLLSTKSFPETVATIFENTRHYRFWINISSFLYTIVPGLLNQVLPWEYWGEVLTFLVVVCGFAIALRAAGLEWRQAWIVLLAYGASPVLLSFSLMGYPAATTVLPHAIALLMVTSPSLRRSFWRTTLVGLLTVEISWHLYEGGRMILVVWILAALLLPAAPLRARGAWLGLAGLQIWMLDRFRSAATDDVKGSLQRILDPEAVWNAVLVLLDKLYVHPSLSLPTLFSLAALSLLLVRRNRLFWMGVVGAQLFLMLLLANISPGQLIARRFVTLEFYCLMSTLVLVRHLLCGDVALPRRFVTPARNAVLGALVLGNLAQIGAMAWHFRTPVADNKHPLPFTSAVDDLKVHSRHVDWSHALAERVHAGKKLILLYNFSTWAEWPTDPVAVLERLYLRLGPRRFGESVYVFAEQVCRSDCLPLYPAASLDEVIATLADGSLGPLQDFEVHYLASDPPRDLPGAMELLQSRFSFGEPQGDDFARHFELLGVRAQPE